MLSDHQDLFSGTLNHEEARKSKKEKRKVYTASTPSRRHRHRSRPPDPPVFLAEISFGPETPVEIGNDHVLTSLDIALDLHIARLPSYWEVGQGEIPFMVAFSHECVEGVVRLLFGLALTDEDSDEVVLESLIL